MDEIKIIAGFKFINQNLKKWYSACNMLKYSDNFVVYSVQTNL